MRADAGSHADQARRHIGKRASAWPRDDFWRNTMAPRSSWPTMWKEFLPISIPTTAIAAFSVWDMACSLSLAPLPSILLPAGREHGRAIPLTDIRSELLGSVEVEFEFEFEFGSVLLASGDETITRGAPCFIVRSALNRQTKCVSSSLGQ